MLERRFSRWLRVPIGKWTIWSSKKLEPAKYTRQNVMLMTTTSIVWRI